MKIKLSSFRFIAAFCVAFSVTQMLIPVILPYGGHDVLSSDEKIIGLVNPAAYVPYLIVGAALFVPVSWPLHKLPIRWAFIYGIVFASLLGITLFPYDVFELGFFGEEYRPVSYLLWVFLITSPWMICWRKRKRIV